MLENWVFMTGLLIACLVALFHGCVLLFAPARYLPSYHWGEGSLRLARKPPFQLGKRLGGLILSTIIAVIFMRPAVLWMLHSKLSQISWGESPLRHGTARWDQLVFAIFGFVCSYFLFTRPARSVELMFSADKSKLEDKVTLSLWTLYVQLSALFFMVWSLLPAAAFIKSILGRS